MFLPRNSSVLSWRSKVCLFSNDDIRELEEYEDMKEQVAAGSSEYLPDSNSVQDLTSLFSKLSLREAIGNVAVDAQDEKSSVDAGFSDEQSNQEYSRDALEFFNSQEPIIPTFKDVQLVHNQNLSNYIASPFEPWFSSNLPSCFGNVILYKSSRIRTECAETICGEGRNFHREDHGTCWMPTNEAVRCQQKSSLATNHCFIDPVGSFYRYRSPFSSFLTTLLARAGRFKDYSDHSARENICTHEGSLNERESGIEMRQEESNCRFSLRRVPSQKQEVHPDEQQTHDEHSLQKEIEGNLAAEFCLEFCVKDATSMEDLGADPKVRECCFEEHESSNRARKTSLQELENEELSVATTAENQFYLDDDETLVAEQDIYLDEELTFSTPEQELTLVAEQARSTPTNEICAGGNVTLAETPEEDTFVAKQEIHLEERTSAKEEDDCVEEECASFEDEEMIVKKILLSNENPVLACMREIDKILDEIEAGWADDSEADSAVGEQETGQEGHEIHLDKQQTYLEGQETDLEREETYLEGQETYLEGQETYPDGHETYSDEQGASLQHHDRVYLDRMETYFEGLGEEIFQTVRNVSPRARDLFQRARNFSRY
jgi:hypothetical protein